MILPKHLNQQLLVFLASMLSAAHLYAANPCALPDMNDGGIGGTGHTLDDGVGGTGVRPDSGVGGTGRSVQDGIGGTGQKLAVIGVITGFASVCVNGIEVHYDDNTQVNINGVQSTPTGLMTGQLVSMTAEKTAKGWNATRINTQDAVSGPITKVIGANRVEVAGQLVNLPNKLDGVPNIGLGQSLRVQGLRAANGEIVATSVTQSNSRQTVITGKLDKRSNGSLGIGNMQIDGLTTQANPGEFVSVTGEMTNGRLRVTQANRTLAVDAGAQQLSIQSVLQSVKDNIMQLNNGIQIHTSRPIKAGGMVRVEAQKDKNGVWQLLEMNNQTHDEIMRRAGKRQQSMIDDEKDNSGKNSRDNESDQDNSGSGNSGSGNSGSGNSGSGNSGSGNSGSGNSGSGSQRVVIDKPSNSGSGSGSADRVRVETPASGGDRVRIERPSSSGSGSADRVRIETPSGADRVRTDRPSNSGSGRGGRG